MRVFEDTVNVRLWGESGNIYSSLKGKPGSGLVENMKRPQLTSFEINAVVIFRPMFEGLFRETDITVLTAKCPAQF